MKYEESDYANCCTCCNVNPRTPTIFCFKIFIVHFVKTNFGRVKFCKYISTYCHIITSGE